ncbi:uncharacterized protein MELLADRAFT_101720 [Melampsora larici-populina 98AG31]|uniref:Uncharacterized protein n=1 Tax=Melampsora larici-populina (strain 98AG31 / pathotype 3-4-7) TaxID=747676 RepID=F4R6R5_MELLP|nr:uncharacterized protein MELLADRAFT_101720 [Melampsora larici-populina 98AG31]EGG11921.1 hypothetical protein MELLADRAFT_101720 [Melampsora larici-populina 98AG31]
MKDLKQVILSVFCLLNQVNQRDAREINPSPSVGPGRLSRRNIPQEWGHAKEVQLVNALYKKDNPLGIVDAVYSFLGDKSATEGAGKFDKTKLHCMKKFIADTAFSVAKKADDKRGMTASIIVASLERNAPCVGCVGKDCTDKFTNPEITRVIMHQDAASKDADKVNKEATLSVAKSLVDIDVDPIMALLSCTWPAGTPNTSNAAGLSCDDPKDPQGCIITKHLLNSKNLLTMPKFRIHLKLYQHLDFTPKELVAKLEPYLKEKGKTLPKSKLLDVPFTGEGL